MLIRYLLSNAYLILYIVFLLIWFYRLLCSTIFIFILKGPFFVVPIRDILFNAYFIICFYSV